jgi:hypothetical protein
VLAIPPCPPSRPSPGRLRRPCPPHPLLPSRRPYSTHPGAASGLCSNDAYDSETEVDKAKLESVVNLTQNRAGARVSETRLPG